MYLGGAIFPMHAAKMVVLFSIRGWEMDARAKRAGALFLEWCFILCWHFIQLERVVNCASSVFDVNLIYGDSNLDF